jgi:hypothetical protein
MKIFSISRKITVVIIFLSAAVWMQSCNINTPTSPTMPTWDVTLNAPLMNKNYTMLDILENKSTSVHHYTDGQNQGLLYYSDVKKVDNISFKDKLTIDPFSASSTGAISTISVNPDSISTDINFSWISSSISPNQMRLIPAVNDVFTTINFNALTQFQSAKISEGVIDIKITNHFPEPIIITIKNIVLKNSGTSETIAQYNQQVDILPLQTITIQSIPLAAGVTAQNQLSMSCRLSANGSSGQLVSVPSSSFTITSVFRNVKVSEATAKIPQQNAIVVNGVLKIDSTSSQPNKFQNVKFDNGLMNLTVTNNLDVEIIVTLTINNLVTPQGSVYSSSQTIPRKQTKSFYSSDLSLKDYSLSTFSGGATNLVSYSVSSQLVAANDYRTIKSGDAVSGIIRFSSISISQFTGMLKPVVLSTIRTAVSLGVKDIQKKLQFQQVSLENSNIQLRLHPTANIEFAINGRIEAKNLRGEKSSMTLSARTLYNKTTISGSDTVLTLNSDSVKNFFKRFTSLPDSLIIYTGGTANPNYNSVSVTKNDYVTGSGSIEFPLQFSISGAQYSDSVSVDLSQDDRDNIRNVNSLGASLTVTNGIAASLSLKAKLYDNRNRFLMYFPPATSTQDSIISVDGASTDNQGNATASTSKTITVTARQADAQNISNASYIRVYLNFNTSDNQAVKFKTSDAIKITASGSTNYHVKP